MAVFESKRGLGHPPASIAVMMIVAAVIMINANCGGAAVLVKSNDTYGCISGREEECLIAGDMELEYLMMEYSSHVTRLLATHVDSPGHVANKGNKIPCNNGKGNQYNNCKPPRNKPKGPCTPPGKYKRGCQP